MTGLRRQWAAHSRKRRRVDDCARRSVQGNSGFVGSTTGGFVNNQGTIIANGGGTLTVQGDANFSGGTLSGGNWQAVANGTLRLLGANVVTSTGRHSSGRRQRAIL